MSNRPLFVISLDFELMWGMFDKVTVDQYGRNIAGVHTAIPEILTLFKENNIHATWATVGMLMHKDKQSLLNGLPQEELRPIYDDMRISSYEHIAHTNIGNDTNDDPYHYGEHLVNQILSTLHQELASHTFSHYYCIDGSKNDTSIFRADCEAFNQVSQKIGQPITSIIFPRNQTTKEALLVCKDYGITTYRGTPSHVLYTGKEEKAQTSLILRMLRIVDAYINISGHHTFSYAHAKDAVLTNIAGSRFLRPYSKRLSALEPLRIKRIKDSMTHAAQHNEIFHLWWHPHNFGINRKENLANLLEIIRHYNKLNTEYGMQSVTMREATICVNESLS